METRSSHAFDSDLISSPLRRVATHGTDDDDDAAEDDYEDDGDNSDIVAWYEHCLEPARARPAC